MKSALLVTLGGALGALLMGATVWGLGLSNHKQATRLDALGRDLLIGASIEAIAWPINSRHRNVMRFGRSRQLCRSSSLLRFRLLR